jgi:hypothetical protein
MSHAESPGTPGRRSLLSPGTPGRRGTSGRRSLLPPKPNLEYLKKEAKALLRERTDWQLADAQHALALEYGFESWPKLKAHVELLASAVSPFAGRWRADVSKSQRHPANLFQHATLEFVVDGETVTIVHEAVDESGRVDRGVNTLKVDGVEQPFDFGRRGTVRMVNPHRVELKTTFAGIETRLAEYEVSADGRTLSVTTPHQHLVFDRA